MLETRILESESINRLASLLANSPQKILPYLEDMMQKVMFILLDEVSPYPPATEANRPGRRNAEGELISYYERGKGSWRPIKRIKTLELHLAKKDNKAGRSLGRGIIPTPGKEIAGYVLRPTSEQMGKNWTTQVHSSSTEVIGELSNPTSYADHVQGFEQASFHADRDWITVEQSLQVVEPQILQLADAALDRFIQTELG